MFDALWIPSSRNRCRLLALTALLVLAIASLDWWHPSYISLGFLYAFPLMLAGGILGRQWVVTLALVCAGLQEAFGDLPAHESVARFALTSLGFTGIGLFVSESVRSRARTTAHLREREVQMRLRSDAEEQLRALVESSPAAIVAIERTGQIVLANQAAQYLFGPDGEPLEGQHIGDYMPSLQRAVEADASRTFHTTLQGKATRRNGEVFLAAAWFSTYVASGSRRLSAIVVDLSEDLRSREDVGLDHMLRHTRIVMSAVAHEIRNICSAVRVVHKNLSRLEGLERNEDFVALGTLIVGLEKLTEEELRPVGVEEPITLDLSSALDELRVVAEPMLAEQGIASYWPHSSELPMVVADRHGLMQVFLNLVRNSEHAMRASEVRQLRVTVFNGASQARVQFVDTGPGVLKQDRLFHPSWHADGHAGLGLYVSRAIMRSFGGDLLHEPTESGAHFAVVLRTVTPAEGEPDA
jgi:two-component system sensor kinase FixL